MDLVPQVDPWEDLANGIQAMTMSVCQKAPVVKSAQCTFHSDDRPSENCPVLGTPNSTLFKHNLKRKTLKIYNIRVQNQR